MATVTHGIQTGSTTDTTSYAAASFTPALNDLLVCMVGTTDTVDSFPTVTSTGNTAAWTRITSAKFGTNAHSLYVFVQNALCANTATTVTFNCPNDAATGAVVAVTRIAGMTRVAGDAVRQFAILQNQSYPTLGTAIVSPVLKYAALTGNPTLECEANNVADSFVPPTNWTEGVADTTYATPAGGFEYHFRNSGFTGTTSSWADTTGIGSENLAMIFLEMDASAVGVAGKRSGVVSQAINRAGTY